MPSWTEPEWLGAPNWSYTHARIAPGPTETTDGLGWACGHLIPTDALRPSGRLRCAACVEALEQAARAQAASEPESPRWYAYHPIYPDVEAHAWLGPDLRGRWACTQDGQPHYARHQGYLPDAETRRCQTCVDWVLAAAGLS